MMTAETTRSPATARRASRWYTEARMDLPRRPVDLVLTTDGSALTGVRFGRADDHRDRLQSSEQPPPGSAAAELLAETTGQLAAYAAGTRQAFDVPLSLEGTAFQRDVWQYLLGIPYGTTTTYSALAAAIGRPGRARPVGAAVGANPIGIIVPCHRVVGSNGALTGFAGGLDNKAALLAHEGVLGL